MVLVLELDKKTVDKIKKQLNDLYLLHDDTLVINLKNYNLTVKRGYDKQ